MQDALGPRRQSGLHDPVAAQGRLRELGDRAAALYVEVDVVTSGRGWTSAPRRRTSSCSAGHGQCARHHLRLRLSHALHERARDVLREESALELTLRILQVVEGWALRSRAFHLSSSSRTSRPSPRRWIGAIPSTSTSRRGQSRDRTFSMGHGQSSSRMERRAPFSGRKSSALRNECFHRGPASSRRMWIRPGRHGHERARSTPAPPCSCSARATAMPARNPSEIFFACLVGGRRLVRRDHPSSRDG